MATEEVQPKYKFSDEGHTEVINKVTGAAGIHPGVWMWEDYQAWVAAGGITEAYQTLPEEKLTNKAKDEERIRKTYEDTAHTPVTVGTYTYNGGFESAAYIKGAVELAEALGEPNVQITDISNVRRTMSFADAKALAITIGKAYRDAFYKKQDDLVAVTYML